MSTCKTPSSWMRGEKKQQEGWFISRCVFQALCGPLELHLAMKYWWGFLPWGDGFNEHCPKMHWVLSLQEAFYVPVEEMLQLVVHKTQKALNKVSPSAQKTVPPTLQNFRTYYNSEMRRSFFVRQGDCSFIGLLNFSWFQLLPWLLTQLTCTEHFQSWLKKLLSMYSLSQFWEICSNKSVLPLQLFFFSILSA